MDLQKTDLYEIVSVRQAISTELRRWLTGATIDDSLVRSLSARYGRLEGGISYNYATHSCRCWKDQHNRAKAEDGCFEEFSQYVCNGAYLYSQPINYPENISTDSLFTSGGTSPTITGITPESRINTENVTVTITGANFRTGVAVKLIKGNYSITGSIQRLTDTLIICLLPLKSSPIGVYNFTITNTNGTIARKQSAFTVDMIYNTLTITTISPKTGYNSGNVHLNITGTNFKSGAIVKLTKGAVSKGATIQRSPARRSHALFPLLVLQPVSTISP